MARWYDGLTWDVDYENWADWLESRLQAEKVTGKLALDLACGTGTLSCLLARRGYSVIGTDQSPDMLTQAAEKAEGLTGGEAPLFLCQPMEELELYSGVDFCTCCLDGLNYVTHKSTLKKIFRRVYAYLLPGGLFLFDLQLPEKLEKLDGQSFLDETEDVYCVWQAEYDCRRQVCTYSIDLFQREPNGLWSRASEEHEERAWPPEQISEWLRETGFKGVRQFRRRGWPGRVFFTAKKAESQ